MQNVLEDVIYELTKMRIKEHEKKDKNQIKYAFTTEELIAFCIKLLKEIEREVKK